MKKINLIALAVLIAVAGYWLGNHTVRDSGFGIPDSGTSVLTARKILYYRNPMGLPDTSPVPKKDGMGMDYVAVYEGEAVAAEGAVSISADKVQKTGVSYEAASLRRLDKTIQVSGRIEIDERRTFIIAPKVEGWVEHLYVNSTGQQVSRGQPLFDVYSPELVSVQREYTLAVQGESALAVVEAKAGMKQLADASLARMKNWDMADRDIKQLSTGLSRRTLSYYAPASGIVLEKKAVQGMRFSPGEALYQIADLSQVWMLADITEQDSALIKVGRPARVSLSAYPEKSFEGKVAFIYPTLNTSTRTVQVRVELSNPEALLKPGMFANLTLSLAGDEPVLCIPVSSVIDSGTRQIVLIQRVEGHFAPRTVKLGRRGVDYVEVLEGIAAGEKVVTSALFLIDAESNLKAALSGLGGAENPVQSAVQAVVRGEQKAVGHRATGILDAINKDGSVSITHEPIKTLGWPGMSMEFSLANESLAKGIKPGSAVAFELIERAPDEWVITRLQVRSPHEGH